MGKRRCYEKLELYQKEGGQRCLLGDLRFSANEGEGLNDSANQTQDRDLRFLGEKKESSNGGGLIYLLWGRPVKAELLSIGVKKVDNFALSLLQKIQWSGPSSPGKGQWGRHTRLKFYRWKRMHAQKIKVLVSGRYSLKRSLTLGLKKAYY